MEIRGETAGGRGPLGEERRVIYCVIPADLAGSLHDPLRRHFRERPDIEVIVERRGRDRRSGANRRAAETNPVEGDERRRVRNPSGRRVAERRSPLTVLDPAEIPKLPRRAARHRARIAFHERTEPEAQAAEDADTSRLVVRFQAGERDVFTQLYMRYFDRVYGYLRALLNDRHEAEDVTQQVFIGALESLPDYEQRGRPFRAWLFVVARNAAVSILRKRSRTDLVEPDELAEHRREREENGAEAELPALGWVSDRDLLVLIERLPLAQRQVLVLRHLMDMTARQVADILGKNENEVRMLQHRAHKFLRHRLTSLGRGPSRGGERIRWRGRKRQAVVLRERRFVLYR